MRSIKHIALSIVLTLSVFCAVLYTSCSKDGCKGVTCLNGGVCSGGICGSCPTGIGGSNCQTIYRELYRNNSYAGLASYTDTNYTVVHTDAGNTLSFSSLNDSSYARMQMSWTRPGRTGANTKITLSKNTATGTTFTVDQFPIDTFTCTGSGTINENTVSLNLTATPPHSHAIIISLSNLSKQ